MQFRCSVCRLPDGRWSVRHDGSDVGPVELTAATKDEALEKMRAELRFRLELCPCTGEAYQHLAIEIIEEDR